MSAGILDENPEFIRDIRGDSPFGSCLYQS